MVNNNNIILDEGELKNVAEVIEMPYSRKTMELFRQYDKLMSELHSLQAENRTTAYGWAPSGKKKRENQDRIVSIRLELFRMDENMEVHKKQIVWDNIACNPLKVWQKECCDMVERIHHIPPITPAIMINISPEKMEATEDNMKRFCEVIDNYSKELNSSRYSRIEYILENGKKGDHLHLHGLFHINPKMVNSVLDGKNSHIRSSKHIRQIKHWWNKGGFGGIQIQIQCTICRVEELMVDKLSYLNPHTKPLGHENYSKIMDIKVLEF